MSSQPKEMRRVLVFLKMRVGIFWEFRWMGRDGFGVGVYYRDESKGILVIFSNLPSTIIDMRVLIFWVLS